MLEKLGAITQWSCEGHPTGFYIVFAAPLALAQKIHSCGFVCVEIAGGWVEVNGEQWPRWAVRLNTVQTEEDRVRVLKWAAESWLDTFDEIRVVGDQVVNKKKVKA